jgi:hypothetical protein
MVKVKTDRMYEAIAKKLSGITTVPPVERSRMMSRAVKAAAEIAREERAELEAENKRLMGQVESMKNCQNCKHSTAPTMSEHIKHCRPCQDSEERYLNWEPEALEGGE